MNYPLHRVSCKAALYSPDGESVIVIDFPDSKDGYGLPGGHLEHGEQPEDAIKREIKEEIGHEMEFENLSRKDFWIHESGKVVLGFTGTALSTKLPRKPRSNREIAIWVKLTDIREARADAGTYNKFILDNQPKITVRADIGQMEE